MIYLAVLLVLTGLLIVLVALFSESGIRRSSCTGDYTGNLESGRDVMMGVNPEDVDIIIPGKPDGPGRFKDEEDIFVSFEEKDDYRTVQKRKQSQDEWEFDDSDQDDLIPDSGPLTEIAAPVHSDFTRSVKDRNFELPAEKKAVTGDGSEVYAVLFDDRSNLIDYDSGGSIIGPSIQAYKNIKRIGRGEVRVDDDGVSFYMGERFFRFDFHKVYDVWSGSGFIALPLRGGNSVKLFMIEKAPDFPDRVEFHFQKYTKGI